MKQNAYFVWISLDLGQNMHYYAYQQIAENR
jgi:hypothetical protein